MPIDNFQYLSQFWPDLYDLARKAEASAAEDPQVSAIRLRGFVESMVEELFDHLDLPLHHEDKLLDRLLLLERAGILDNRRSAKFHTIRKIGNRGAHSKKVSVQQAQDLVVDAWSLGCWFCRLLKPDVEWFIRPYGTAPQSTSQPTKVSADELPIEELVTPTGQSNVLQFPPERIRRIRDEVAKAMALVEPAARQLRTKISIEEAFTDPLNADQQQCLQALEGFLADPDERIFLLKGDAGTGKTFLACGLIEYLSTQGRAIRVAAPTGRAAKVIGEKSERQASTLHALIYDYRNVQEYKDESEDIGTETFKVHALVANNRDTASTVYIVDEASLISDMYSESDFYRSGSGYLLQDLISYADFGNSANDRKIIFLGDPAQLNPVGMAKTPALDAEYFSKQFGLKTSEYRLTEVVRQKSESGVLRNVAPIRRNLETGVFSGLSIEFADDVHRVTADEVVPLYMTLAKDDGAELPIIIAKTNREAAELNREVHHQLFPDRQMVTAGDRLLITANTMLNERFLANGEFVRVSSAAHGIEIRTVTLSKRHSDTGKTEKVEVQLSFRDMEIAIPLADGTEAFETVKVLDNLLHDGQSNISSDQQRALYVDFLMRHPDLRKGDRSALARALRNDSYFNAVRAKFGYAVTCHKAQGGEWKNVIVICPGAKDPRNPDYFRWLYTAMTRSSDQLYLVNAPQVTIQATMPDFTGLEKFQHDLLAQIRGLLDRTQIEIEDVAHNQWQEAYYLRRGEEAVRANIGYNGKLKVSRVTPAQQSPFGSEVARLLQSLVGNAPLPDAMQPEELGMPTRPFLIEFHERLVPALGQRDIRVSNLKEQPWSQRYTCQRGQDITVIDVFYDGKNRLTKCMPVGQVSSSALLRDALEVITGMVL
ncbi:ATP-dependent RecD-like DNA helicase [Sphingobium sp. DC-2]|uniref:ATP-dependent DNA helicase n=1 Tax=Sphingobium sp. DC-2 TaxID=1303256 RepID=UPI0009DE412F|nr:DEAD/DEAH box helicase [Sphingobium sp. DC-2]